MHGRHRQRPALRPSVPQYTLINGKWQLNIARDIAAGKFNRAVENIGDDIDDTRLSDRGTILAAAVS